VRSRRIAAALAALAATALAGCGKPDSPAASAEVERAQALERARQDVFGAQVRSIDRAKGVEADVNKKAQDNLEAVDRMSK
jgi:hypothetical protein